VRDEFSTHQHEAMTAATDVDDDWLLTIELLSSLRATGGGSKASTQQHDRYMLRDRSVVTAIRSGHRIHGSEYYNTIQYNTIKTSSALITINVHRRSKTVTS